MVIEKRRFRVINPITGYRFVASDPEKMYFGSLEQTEEYHFDSDDLLELSAEKKNDMGRVTHWRVKAEGRPDVIVKEMEVDSWRHECIIEFPAI